MNTNNVNIAELMQKLSKMDKKELENGITKLNSILNSKDKSQIIDSLKNNMNNN